MKTPKPQNVTLRPYGSSMFAESESGTARMLYNIAIYDECGIICNIDYYSFSKLNIRAALNIPITWKTATKPNYTEARAHFVSCIDGITKKYMLLIPSSCVTLSNGHRGINRRTAQVTQSFTVEEIPAPFTAVIVHPFDRYAIVHELEELEKHAYNIFTADEITRQHNRERIAQFVAHLAEYTTEAERIQTESNAEYLRECDAAAPRFDFQGNHFYRIASAKEA